MLDEELDRLLQKSTAPLTLCYLEGKTYTGRRQLAGGRDGVRRLARSSAVEATLTARLRPSATALTTASSADGARRGSNQSCAWGLFTLGQARAERRDRRHRPVAGAAEPDPEQLQPSQ